MHKSRKSPKLYCGTTESTGVQLKLTQIASELVPRTDPRPAVHATALSLVCCLQSMHSIHCFGRNHPGVAALSKAAYRHSSTQSAASPPEVPWITAQSFDSIPALERITYRYYSVQPVCSVYIRHTYGRHVAVTGGVSVGVSGGVSSATQPRYHLRNHMADSITSYFLIASTYY